MDQDLISRTSVFFQRFGIADSDYKKEIERFHVSIEADQKILESYSGQLMLLTLANILPRIWASVSLPVCGSTNRCVFSPLSKAPTLSEAASETLQIASTAVDHSLCGVSSRRPADFIISIGPTIVKSNIYINADGWVAYLRGRPEDVSFSSSATNPFGPIAAACFAAAEASREFLRRLGTTDDRIQRPFKPFKYSILRNSEEQETDTNIPLPKKLDLGDITLVGAGAVGSSMIYTLSAIPQVFGTMKIIDDQKLDASNLNRHLIAGKKDIGEPKAIVAEKALTKNMIPDPLFASYESYENRQSTPVIVSTVDNRDNNAIRRAIQSDLPRFIIHGATGDAFVAIAKLDFSSGACLGCLFPEELNPQVAELTRLLQISSEEAEQLIYNGLPFLSEHAKQLSSKIDSNEKDLLKHVGKPFIEVFQEQVCGNLRTQVGETVVEAAVPFVSLMAGAMACAEIIKMVASELTRYQLNNYRRLSLFGLGNEFICHRKKEATCSCYCQEDILQKRFKKKWGL